jgi:hypothetical protein
MILQPSWSVCTHFLVSAEGLYIANHTRLSQFWQFIWIVGMSVDVYLYHSSEVKLRYTWAAIYHSPGSAWSCIRQRDSDLEQVSITQRGSSETIIIGQWEQIIVNHTQLSLLGITCLAGSSIQPASIQITVHPCQGTQHREKSSYYTHITTLEF